MANIILDGTTLNGVTYLDVPKAGGGTARFSEGGGGGNYQSKTKTYTPTESQQTETVTAGSGYDALSSVAITVNAVSSSYVGSAIAQNDSSDLTASGATVTAPAGYYANNATKTVASGTAGTPTATKGTVSSHSVTVTPSVTNTTGYITGGTKTGTGVTVTASELVSGSQNITVNDTYDVTNLANVVVSVPSGSPTLQDKTKSYTPTETAQTETITADGGYDGLRNVGVSVGAIPSNYIGSGVPQKSSADLTVSGATVTAPSGYYSSSASATVASGSATTPATTINPSIFIGVQTNGQIDVNVSKTKSVTPTVSAGYVSSGTAGTITVSGTASSQLDTLGATTYTPTSSDQTIADQQYLIGTQTIEGIVCSNLAASNIKAGVTVKVGTASDDDSVTSVLGTYTGTSPTGSTNITTNGSHDVTNFATAVVNVPSSVGTKTSSSLSSTTTTLSISGLSGKPVVWALQNVVSSGSYFSGASTRYITSCLCSGGSTVYSLCLYKSGSTAREYGYNTCTWSYSSGTITITSPGTSTAGGFRTGSTYRLFYAY